MPTSRIPAPPYQTAPFDNKIEIRDGNVYLKQTWTPGWLAWLNLVFRDGRLAEDTAAITDVFSETFRDLGPEIAQEIEALRETRGRDIAPEIRERIEAAREPGARDWTPEIEELRGGLAALRDRPPFDPADIERALAALQEAGARFDSADIERAIAAADVVRVLDRELTDLAVVVAAIQEPATPLPLAPHAATHQNGGSDEVAVAVAAANAIPKANAGGTFDPAWLAEDTVSLLNQNASLGPTGLTVNGAAAPAGLYSVRVYAETHTAGTGNITVAVAGVASFGILLALTAANAGTADFLVRSDGTGVTYTITYAATGAYDVRLVMRRVS